MSKLSEDEWSLNVIVEKEDVESQTITFEVGGEEYTLPLIDAKLGDTIRIPKPRRSFP